jgi:phospholipid-binding lipoprotein MlaA
MTVGLWTGKRARWFRLAMFGALALGLSLASPAGAAQLLPSAFQQNLQMAATEGQRARSTDALYFNADRRAGNHLLSAAALNAISQRPDLTGSIVAEAVRLAPENRDHLVAELVSYLPGFADTIIAAASGQQPVLAAAPVQPAPVLQTAPTPALAPAPTPAVSSAELELALAPVYPDAAVVAIGPEVRASPGVPAPADRPAGWPILPEEGGADGYADDPLEGLNKVFFYVNGTLDFLVFEPLARVYRFLMPDVAKPHIRNAFENLGLPVVFGNDLLQLEVEDAGETLARFAVNSTVGVAGLFDVAAEWGIPPHSRDFGQTLHSYGAGEGFYLVLPLFGPSNVRDAIGTGVDSLMDPKNYLLESTEVLLLGLGQGIVEREAVIDPVDFIKEHAGDKYAAVRAWSWQQRQIELDEGCERRAVIVCPAP